MSVDDDPSDRPKGWLDRLAALSIGDAAGLVVSARGRIRDNPVEHVKAAADVTRWLGEAKAALERRNFGMAQRAVFSVAQRDWVAASVFAEAMLPLAHRDPDSLRWVAEGIARCVGADRTLSRQLARVLPDSAVSVDDLRLRSRLIEALSELCAIYPGLGFAALPTLRKLLSEGPEEGVVSFLEDALEAAARSESIARSFLLRESLSGQEAWAGRRQGLAVEAVVRSLQLYAEARIGRALPIEVVEELAADPLAAPRAAVARTDGAKLKLISRVSRFVEDDENYRLYKVAVAHELGRIEFGSFDLQPFQVAGLDPREVHGEEETDIGAAGQAADTPGSCVEEFCGRFPESGLARRLMDFAEDLRVDACLRRSYSGLARSIEAIAAQDSGERPALDALRDADLLFEVLTRWLYFGDPLPAGSAFERFHRASWLLESLRHPGAGVQDSAAVVAALYPVFGGLGLPQAEPAAGGLEEDPDRLRSLMTRFIARGLGPVELGPNTEQSSGMGAEGEQPAEAFEADLGLVVQVSDRPKTADAVDAGELKARLFDGRVPGEDLSSAAAANQAWLESAAQSSLESQSADPAAEGLRARARRIQAALEARGVERALAEVEVLLALSPGLSDSGIERALSALYRRPGTGNIDSETYRLADQDLRLFEYHEWDRQIADYRPNWCRVWERRAEGNASAFVDAVVSEHAALVRRLRREFQMLRPAALGLRRREPEGDLLDLDALVDELLENRRGRWGEGRVHKRSDRRRRDVAVAFLVDLSASTREGVASSGKSVVEVEKEALVLMSEALDALGDRYGIFGFSGRGREMVAFDVFKDFDEPFGESVRGRIGAMTYQMENRDGAAIRHATRRLLEVDARTRLLVLLSDGKPLDCGCDLYQSSYAQEDTRMALREARNLKVHPFCITVDPGGEEYLPDLYGEVRFVVIDGVAELPRRLPALYRKLTTR